jgi:hypothetical protein
MEQKYKAKFNQLSETRVDSTTSTVSMQNIVQTVDTLEKKYLHDPEEMLALISNDISLFSDIRVKNINWFVTNYSGTENYEDVQWDKPKKRRKRKVDKTGKKAPKAPKAKKGYFEIALVEGEFIDFDGNYRYALSAVDDLEKAMSESGKYYSVEITKRPLDIESDNRLSGDVSTDRPNNLDYAEIAMRIVREVPGSE